MNVRSSWLGSLLAWAFLALGAGAAPPTLEVVGPAQPERMLSLPPGSGTLRVYSDTIKVAAARGGSAVDYPHSGYVLLSGEGQMRQHVENNNSAQKESPVPVVLPAGRYMVRARSAGYGEVQVPVEIAAGESTLVYLTTRGMPVAVAAGGNKIVRLPNGRAVGVGVTTGR